MKGVLSEEDLLYKNESSKGPYIVELGDKSSIMRKMNMRMI